MPDAGTIELKNGDGENLRPGTPGREGRMNASVIGVLRLENA
jgi:hypothetical protein